jgi:ankyrin repeat protein
VQKLVDFLGGTLTFALRANLIVWCKNMCIVFERGVLLAIDSIEVNSKDNLGMTPLWIAAERGHKRVVEALAESDSIEVISKNKDGKTPLSMTAEWIHKG